MINTLLKVHGYVKGYYSLFLSLRFILLFLCAILAAGFSIALYSAYILPSYIPLPVYPAWLIITILSLLVAFGKSPSERHLIKNLADSLSDLRYSDAEVLLGKAGVFLFFLPTAKVEIDRLKISFFEDRGELAQAYELLNKLRGYSLLPKESADCELDYLNLIYSSGNHRAANEHIEKLKNIKLKPSQTDSLLIIESAVLIEGNKLSKAKHVLEDALNKPALKKSTKAVFLHNLAIVDTHQENYESALSHYRNSWTLQKESKSNFAQAEMTVDNLVLTYAKLNQLDKIEPLLKELKPLTKLNSIDQRIALHNIKINLARQLNNPQALLECYEEADQELLPFLYGERKFIYTVRSLRMHWNDDVNFKKALEDILQAMIFRPEISDIDFLRSIKEVAGTAKQAIAKHGPSNILMTFHSWLLLEFKRMQPSVDRLLDELPVSLPGPRDELIGYKIESIKFELSCRGPSKELFAKLFELLGEKKNIWQGMHNSYAEFNSLLVLMDEFVAYSQQIDDQKFKQDFEALFNNAFSRAEELQKEMQGHLGYPDFLIGMAYFCCKNNIEKNKAMQWVKEFEASKLSLNNYAAWLRQQYKETKQWLEEDHS